MIAGMIPKGITKSVPLAVIWRCAVIALLPILIWAMSGPTTQTIWQRAGDRHYQVRFIPGALDFDNACLILKIEHITPTLEPFTCWN